MITIYGKDNCKYCDAAVKLCKIKSLSYTYLKLDEDYTKPELIEKFPEARTFPQITLNDQSIGGFSDLKALVLKQQ
jgi:glutaredoxin